MTELFIPAPTAGRDGPTSTDVEFAILYGLHLDGDVGMASISTGLSLVESNHLVMFDSQTVDSGYIPPHYVIESVVSLGIPLEAQVMFNLGSHTGLGATYFANFNRHYSYQGGLMIFRYRFH